MNTTTARDRLASAILDGWRVFTGITNLEMAEHLADCLIRDGWAPPAELPATLAPVNDVRRVCEAAGLTFYPHSRWILDGPDQSAVFVDVDVFASGAVRSVEVGRNTPGDEYEEIAELDCAAPGVLLWHAVQAARSTP